MCLFQLYHLHNGRLHKRLKVACIESQSIMVEDKQNYYHPLPVSVKAHLASHSNSCFVCKLHSWKRLKGAMLLRSFCRGTADLVHIWINNSLKLQRRIIVWFDSTDKRHSKLSRKSRISCSFCTVIWIELMM